MGVIGEHSWEVGGLCRGVERCGRFGVQGEKGEGHHTWKRIGRSKAWEAEELTSSAKGTHKRNALSPSSFPLVGLTVSCES
jgi:hypothetical protein